MGTAALYEIIDCNGWFRIDCSYLAPATNVNIRNINPNRDSSDERARRLAISIDQHNCRIYIILKSHTVTR